MSEEAREIMIKHFPDATNLRGSGYPVVSHEGISAAEAYWHLGRNLELHNYWGVIAHQISPSGDRLVIWVSNTYREVEAGVPYMAYVYEALREDALALLLEMAGWFVDSTGNGTEDVKQWLHRHRATKRATARAQSGAAEPTVPPSVSPRTHGGHPEGTTTVEYLRAQQETGSPVR